MLYTISGIDQPDSLALRKIHGDEHRNRLRQLLEQGKLIFAGPHPAVDAEDPGEAGFTGSLIIAEFGSLELAQSWAADDVYVRKNIYQTVSVKPVKRVLP